jgi:probable HAF family extracellular repeat protein
VGYYGAGTRTHGFLLDNGNYTTLDVPGSSSTWATGINASGQIVGSYSDGTGSHGFLLDNGSYTTLDVPGSTGTWANGINASDQIVGSYSDVSGNAHGFLLDNGSYTDIGFNYALGINDSGQIVGVVEVFVYDIWYVSSYLQDNGSVTRLDVPGSGETDVRGINNSGQIVGLYFGDAGYHSFLLDHGRYTMVRLPTGLTGINASGQIVGSYEDAAGTHGFLATPVP